MPARIHRPAHRPILFHDYAFGEHGTRAEECAKAVNRVIRETVLACTDGEEIKNSCDISVIGYGKFRDNADNAFSGELAAKPVATIQELTEHCLRIESIKRKVSDGADGLVEIDDQLQYYLTRVQAPKRQWWQAGSASKDHGSAAFLGLCLDVEAEDLGYQAIALGDSCLFHWHPQQQSLQSFPIQTAAAFKSTTQCLESLPEYNHFSPKIQQGCYQKDDVFWLASDALAHWILTEIENGSIEWEVILNISDREAFRQLIRRLRQEKRIKNDDTTLAILRPGS